MCGICGYIGPERDGTRAILEAMTRTLVHRGPDDEGYFYGNGVGFGARRLSIIDIRGGHQPLHNEDGTIWVALNGEIYNYRELQEDLEKKGHQFSTRTDTEVLVHAYEESGPDFVRQLNGMFAFALWDGKEKRLVLARDRLGIKPLYYIESGKGLIFASEPKALLAHPDVSAKLNMEALKKYLVLEFIPSPHSIFQGIEKLLPGHILINEKGRARIERYWGLSYTKCGPPTEDEAADDLLHLLRSSVSLRLRSDVPLGVFLSGGIDSSTVAAVMAECAPGRVKSFSIGFDDPAFDESHWAEESSRYIGTDHRLQKLSPKKLLELIPHIGEVLDEPLGDASIVPTYLLSKFTREHVTVALGGDGGDELFAGYPTYQAHRLAGIFDRLPSSCVAAMRMGAEALPSSFGDWTWDFKAKRFFAGLSHVPPVRHHIWVGSFSPEEADDVIVQDCPCDPLGDAKRYWEECDSDSPVERAQYLDLKLYLQDDILTKVDRASMACSLEVRSPFLDYRIVEFLACLPSRMKLKGLTRKYILRKAAEGLLPSGIAGRKKKGFSVPVARWLNGELKELADALLNERRLNKEGIFRWDVVKRLLEEHRAGFRDHRKKLWTLLIFELWHNTWM